LLSSTKSSTGFSVSVFLESAVDIADPSRLEAIAGDKILVGKYSSCEYCHCECDDRSENANKHCGESGGSSGIGRGEM
jgi:hypothetical protein